MTPTLLDRRMETTTRSMASRTTRRGALTRLGGVMLAVAGGESLALAVGAAPALAAFSPLCGGICMGSCPSGTTTTGGCWWGCDAATSGCCSGKQRIICDCTVDCPKSPGQTCDQACANCGKLCAIYDFSVPMPGNTRCTRCRRVTDCSTQSC